MAAEEGDCKVQVVNAFSDEILCTLELPSSSTVLEVKRRVQATQGINIFRQRLVIPPLGHQAEDHEALASFPGLLLQLIKLEYADDRDKVGRLIRAADTGAAPEVEQLLRLPFDPDCTRAEDNATPLTLASRGWYLEVVRLLCEAGADKDKEIEMGVTALILASDNMHLELARLLCEAGADKDKAKWYGDTALISASQNGHLEVARLLCDAGADKDKANQYGITALMAASQFGHLEGYTVDSSLQREAVARLLCEAGADKDKAKRNGDTALILASASGHLELARLLCEAGADKDKANQYGFTALMVASRNGHLDVARLLCEAGATRTKRCRMI